MTLRPVQNIVLIRTADVSETTNGGIVIPECAKQRAREGIVIATGQGKLDKSGVRIPMSVYPGDCVLFEYGRGVVWKDEGFEYRIIREPDIVCVMDKLQGNEFDPKDQFLHLHELN